MQLRKATDGEKLLFVVLGEWNAHRRSWRNIGFFEEIVAFNSND
jgi:hypothetical protein